MTNQQAPVKVAQDKHSTFQRVATAKVRRILSDMRKLKNLTSGNYKSTPEEWTKIFDALRNEVETTVSTISDILSKPVQQAPDENTFNLEDDATNG